MKRFLFIAITALFVQLSFAQNEISRDEHGNKVVRGFLTKQDFMTDTAFTWFAENQKDYVPNPNALAALKANRDNINFIVFGGTWCSDTKFVLPKFFMLADAAGFPQDRITVIGVDHDKKTIQHLAEAFNITNVPTIIVMKEGKAVGRVVEYGPEGVFDKTLGEIISGKKK